MLQFMPLCFLVLAVQGHSSKLQDEADLQSSLMPQELNPDTITLKDQPWKAVMPLLRQRRDVSTEVESPASITATVKRYSRVIACVVLALSSIVEIVLYILDSYLA